METRCDIYEKKRRKMRKKSAEKEKTDESTEREWKMRGERDGGIKKR